MTTPANTNILHPNGFIIQITRADTITFFAQRVNLPGLMINNSKQNNPFVPIPVPGDTAQWDNLQISFLIDEDLRNWEEVFNWFTGITFPRDYQQFIDQANETSGPKPRSEVNMYAQVTVIVLNNQKNPIVEFIFEDCIPANLEGSMLDITQSDVDASLTTLSLEFSNYRMRRLGQA